MAELDIGTHCSVPDCHQLDYLPFRCDGCGKKHCLEHRTAASHDCSNPPVTSVVSPQCPICSQIVPVAKGEDVNRKVDSHIAAGCPKLKEKRHSNKCVMKGCRSYELVPVTCKSCSGTYCLRHRHAKDHNCAAVPSLQIGKTKASLAAPSTMQRQVATSPSTSAAQISEQMYEFQFRFPNGRTVRKSFPASDLVATLYDYAKKATGLQSVKLLTPGRSVIHATRNTLLDEGIGPRSTLIVASA